MTSKTSREQSFDCCRVMKASVIAVIFLFIIEGYSTVCLFFSGAKILNFFTLCKNIIYYNGSFDAEPYQLFI